MENEEDAKKASDSNCSKLGIKNVIITLGDKGAYFANNEESFHVSAMNLGEKVVDTTGAGDAFNGWLCSGINRR